MLLRSFFVRVKANHIRVTAYKYGPNNGRSRKIDFAHILPIDLPYLENKRIIVSFC